MNWDVIKCSRHGSPLIRTLVIEYEHRLSQFGKFQRLELKDQVKRNKLDPIFRSSSSSFLVVLDQSGTSFSSEQLAKNLQSFEDQPHLKTIRFVIGPPYGLDHRLLQLADLKWCLSPLTLPMDLAWLLLWEQLYRGFSIAKGLPYHHG